MKNFTFLSIIVLILILSPFIVNPDNLVLRNGDFSDLVWPDYFFIKQSVMKFHQIPLWNPTLFSGIPEIANPQSPLIYPPNIIALILPINVAIVSLLFLHFFMASLFMYLIGKKLLKWSFLASTTLAFSFTFSPFFWGKAAVGHISQLFASLLLAPVLYFAIKSYFGKGKINYFLTALFLSLQYLNHPTVWFYTVFFGAMVWVYFCLIDKKYPNIIFPLILALLSLFLISPIFLLQLQAGQLITRSLLGISDLSLPVWSIKRFFLGIAVPSNFVGDIETEVWLYPAFMVIVAALIGLLKLKIKFKFIFLVIGLLVIVITLGNRTPIFHLLVNNFPGFSYLRVTTRDFFVMITLLAFLSGYSINGKKNNLLFFIMMLDLIVFSSLRLWSVPKIMIAQNSLNLNSLLSNASFRYYCTRRCLSARDTLPKNIYTADGYHLMILKNYREVISQAGGFSPPKYTGNIPSIDDLHAQPSASLLGKFSVGWVISDNKLSDNNFIYKSSLEGFNLYENKLVLPRVRFRSNKGNEARILLDSPNVIKIKTSGETDTLILSDTFYPGWEVWVDDKRVELEVEDKWARAVNLSKGEHLVEFKFRPFNHIFDNFVSKI